VISRSINSLEMKGLVRGALAPNRSRLRLINLTPAGWQLYHETRAYAREREERLLAGLSRTERVNLTRMLNVVHANMRKAGGS
jgi:DNA-binding MarR family transcriptional regulator